MTEIEKLRKRITELEAEVASLKASQQPSHVIHSHYHYSQPVYQQPTWHPHYPQIWYGGGTMGAIASAAGGGASG